jgi:mRNA interferase MazF
MTFMAAIQMRRGEIVLIADRAGGDYAGKPRPAVVVQSELFQDTGSIAVCLLTAQETGAPLLRIPILATEASGLDRSSSIAVEKLTAVRRDRIARSIGRISDDEALALNRSLAVFLGFA